MKKYLLTAAVMLAGFVVLRAETFETPRGVPQALATADYGGVYVATSVFSSAVSTVCFTCEGVFYGINFSSGSAAAYDFVDVYDATSPVTANLIGAFARIYNVNGSTAPVSNGGAAVSGFNGPPWPIRFFSGLFFKPSVATYNNIGALFWSKDDEN